MEFEWDEAKNQSNIRKHGIDFEDVSEVFDGPMLMDIDNRFDYGEERLIGIGFLKSIVAVVVYIEKYEDTIRIISVRKAERYERKRFEREIQNRLG